MDEVSAVWVREHVFTAAVRRTDVEVPGAYRLCACQWGPCGHCTAGRHAQCVHERFPHRAGRASPEGWLMAPPGARWADYQPVWRVGVACAWTCPCSVGHERAPAEGEQLSLL